MVLWHTTRVLCATRACIIVLVHADSMQTWSMVRDISIPVYHTGQYSDHACMCIELELELAMCIVYPGNMNIAICFIFIKFI